MLRVFALALFCASPVYCSRWHRADFPLLGTIQVVNKIQPYLFSKTFECAYYIWTGSNTIEGHLVHGVWTSAMQNKITISYRDASLSMLVNNKPTVIDYYYEKINSHSPDSTDLTALQQLPNMPVGAFFFKSYHANT